eukprot:6730660-Prymnesium_polylepis.1
MGALASTIEPGSQLSAPGRIAQRRHLAAPQLPVEGRVEGPHPWPGRPAHSHELARPRLWGSRHQPSTTSRRPPRVHPGVSTADHCSPPPPSHKTLKGSMLPIPL